MKISYDWLQSTTHGHIMKQVLLVMGHDTHRTMTKIGLANIFSSLISTQSSC